MILKIFSPFRIRLLWFVSILVLMEYDLKDDKFPRFQPQTHVSILVLMEYDLKVWPNWKIQAGTASFNPCSNGI